MTDSPPRPHDLDAELDAVMALVRRFAPYADATPDPTFADRPLSDGAPRDASGPRALGFDSVRLVELLLACEAELGVALPVERVLAGPPLTVAGLVVQVRQVATAPGGAS